MTTSDSLPSTLRTDRTTGRRRNLNWWQAIGAGAVAGTVVNLLVLGIARLADASLVIYAPGQPAHPITAGGVIIGSVVPMVGGTLLAVLLSLLWSGFLRVGQIIGGGLALVTVAGPVSGDTDGGTTVALSVMHVVVGVAAVLALEAVRRHRAASAAAGR